MGTYTRTHTRFFSEADLAPIREAIAALAEEWSERRPFVGAETRHAADLRLEQLNIAAQLAGEVCP